MQNWLVIRTRPRWEKRVVQLLVEKGIETFCPLYEVRRRWSDRIKLVKQPVIPLYVFVKVHDNQRTIVRTTPGVVNFVSNNCKPVAVKEKTIQKIRQFKEKYRYLEVRPAVEQENQLADSATKAGKVYVDGLNLFLIGSHQSYFIVEPTAKNH